MPRSILNPKQSDYAGRYRLGAIALVAGLIALLAGFSLPPNWLQTILVSAGVGLVIGGGVVIYSANKSQKRATKARGKN